MPLLEMKSKLSQINTNFGSDTTTAGNTTSFSYDSLYVSTLPSTIDIGWDTTPISNYTSGYALPITTVTTTTTSTLQALTQEEVDLLGDAEHAAGFAGGIAPTVVTLTQPLTTSSPLLPYNPDIAPPSKLLKLHKEGREIDLGFSRSALPLESYYAQLTEDKGILGIRNDQVNQHLGFEQPFIVREIGERWGIDRVQEPSGLGDVVSIGLNVLDNLGGAVFGREPSVFVDRYLADITRLSKAANPALSIFTLKQTELQKRNPFDAITSVKYGLVDASTITIDDPQSMVGALIDGTKLALDPQLYNPLSIYGPLSFNRMGFIDTSKLRSIAAQYAVGVLKDVSETALEFVSEVGTRFIEDIQPLWQPVKKFGNDVIKGLKETILTSSYPSWVKYGIPSGATGIDFTTTLAAPGQSVTDLVSVPALDTLGLTPLPGKFMKEKTVIPSTCSSIK